MRMKTLLLSACLSLTFAPGAMAQSVMGSGVVPASAANSAERAIGFASRAPAGAALVIVMTDAALPPLDGVGCANPRIAKRRRERSAGRAGTK